MSNNRKHDPEQLARVFGALSNPNRLRLFMRLISCCVPGTVCSAEGDTTACVGDLCKEVGIVPSTVSHHLKELRGAGLIRMERRGQKVECWVSPDVLKDLSAFFGSPLAD
jgi:ArsR family transcriptional regulator